MVLPEDHAQPEDEAEFYRRALLLLGDIRETNARICEALERLLGRQSDDPRYRSGDVYRNRG